MIPINRTYAPVQAMVDELVRCGLTHAVTCPGSRNAPLVLALAGDERLTAVSVIDERAAGFMALGMAKASGRPVVVTCTSGTAAANLAPAVHEAWQARVPLIVLSADRPPELRDVGAGQAIDQIRLYGSAAKWFVELGNAEPGVDWNAHVRATACRTWSAAAGGRPGPVHVNLPLREPLAPVPEQLEPGSWQGRADGSPWTVVREHHRAPDGDDVQALAERMAAAPRGVVVCGGGAGDVAEAATRLAARAGWPVLADALSGVRCGHHDLSHVVAHYDVLLRDEAFAAAHAPGLVVRVGDTPTSKPLRAWLDGVNHAVADPFGAWHDPARSVDTVLTADPAATCDALATALEMRAEGADPDWLESWRAADALVPPALAAIPDPFEPKVYAALADELPDGAQVWVSSSMPVREVESFFPVSGADVRFLANRGANGIDGVVASAAGAALATGRPTWVLIGEVALVHDAGGLLAAGRAGADIHVVCVNNGGGGIFDFLPLPAHADADAYEQHVATPTGVEPAALAAVAGLADRFTEVRTDRADSVRLHRELYDRVAERLSRSV